MIRILGMVLAVLGIIGLVMGVLGAFGSMETGLNAYALIILGVIFFFGGISLLKNKQDTKL